MNPPTTIAHYRIVSKLGEGGMGAVYRATDISVSETGVLAYRVSNASANARVQWFDRDGKPGSTLVLDGINREVSLSPDGKRAAISRADGRMSVDIWMAEIDRGVTSRFTFDPGFDRSPVWSPDGRTLAFDSNRTPDGGKRNLYARDSGGAGIDRLLLKSDEGKWLADWSGDGRFLLYSVGNSAGNRELWVLPLEGDRKPFAYAGSPFQYRNGQFSPGVAGAPRLVAYTSNESGRFEVHVQAFPAGEGGKRQVSTEGGSQPRWRRDGKELYYIALDGKLMAMDVTLSPQFERGSPKALFQTRMEPQALAGFFGIHYAPSLDGKRFLVQTRMEESGAMPIDVVLNWTAGLRRQ